MISSISIWVYCFNFFLFFFLFIFWCSRINLRFHVEWTSPATPNYILSPDIYFSQAKCKHFFSIFHILSNLPQLHLFLIVNCDTLLCYFSKQSNFLETLNKDYYEAKNLITGLLIPIYLWYRHIEKPLHETSFWWAWREIKNAVLWKD